MAAGGFAAGVAWAGAARAAAPAARPIAPGGGELAAKLPTRDTLGR